MLRRIHCAGNPLTSSLEPDTTETETSSGANGTCSEEREAPPMSEPDVKRQRPSPHPETSLIDPSTLHSVNASFTTESCGRLDEKRRQVTARLTIVIKGAGHDSCLRAWVLFTFPQWARRPTWLPLVPQITERP